MVMLRSHRDWKPDIFPLLPEENHVSSTLQRENKKAINMRMLRMRIWYSPWEVRSGIFPTCKNTHWYNFTYDLIYFTDLCPGPFMPSPTRHPGDFRDYPKIAISDSVWSKTQQWTSDWSHSIMSTVSTEYLHLAGNVKDNSGISYSESTNQSWSAGLYIPNHRVRGKSVWLGLQSLA